MTSSELLCSTFSKWQQLIWHPIWALLIRDGKIFMRIWAVERLENYQYYAQFSQQKLNNMLLHEQHWNRYKSERDRTIWICWQSWVYQHLALVVALRLWASLNGSITFWFVTVYPYVAHVAIFVAKTGSF